MRSFRAMKALCAAFAMAAVLLVQGCLKTTQVYTIYPDGSGKCDVQMTFLGQMAAMIKMSGGMPDQETGQTKDPKEMIKESLKGKVYWDKLEAKDDVEGAYTITGVAYFEKLSDLSELEAKFEKTAEGYTFHLKQSNDDMAGIPGMDGEGGAEGPEAEQQKAMMKAMMAGFEMKIGVRMPGPVTKIEGFGKQEGRDATFLLSEADLMKMMDTKQKPPTQFTALCGADAEGVAAEHETFKKRLAELKAAAPAEEKKPEGEKAPEGEKKAEPKKDGDF